MKLVAATIASTLACGVCYDAKMTGLTIAFGALAVLGVFAMLLKYLESGRVV